MTILLLLIVLIIIFLGYASLPNIVGRIHDIEEEIEYQHRQIAEMKTKIMQLRSQVEGLRMSVEERSENDR